MDGKTYQEMHVDGGAVAQTFPTRPLSPGTGRSASAPASRWWTHGGWSSAMAGSILNMPRSNAERSASPDAPSPP